jgi:Zn-dependent protease
MLVIGIPDRIVLRRLVPFTATWGSFVPVILFGLLFAGAGRHGSAGSVVAAALVGGIGGALSLIVHELGHVQAARRTDGVEALKISLIAFGAATHLDGAYRSGRDQIRVAIGGPSASLALAVPLALTPALPLPGSLVFALFLLALLNVAIGLVSMAPLHPLDGHKLLVGVVWAVVGSERGARETIRKAGRLVVVAAALGTVFLLTVQPLAGGCIVAIALVFWSERQFVQRGAGPAEGPAPT